MEQGRASSSKIGSTKTEPKSQIVSVPVVSEIGVHQVRHTQIPMYQGRGLEAPMVGVTTHAAGSQGKHK